MFSSSVLRKTGSTKETDVERGEKVVHQTKEDQRRGQKKTKTLENKILMIVLLVAGLWLTGVLFWKVLGGGKHNDHLQHQITAGLASIGDLLGSANLWSSGPCGRSSYNLTHVSAFELINADFEEGEIGNVHFQTGVIPPKGWYYTSRGLAELGKGPTGQHLVPSIVTGEDDHNELSCISQDVDLSTSIKKRIFAGVDTGDFAVVASALIKGPEKFLWDTKGLPHKCGSGNLCDPTFRNILWFRVHFLKESFLDHITGKEGLVRSLISTVESKVQIDDSFSRGFNEIVSVIPPLTRHITIELCGQLRSGLLNTYSHLKEELNAHGIKTPVYRIEGGFDDISMDLYRLPDAINPLTSSTASPCVITKDPMLRIGDGVLASQQIVLIWETNSGIHRPGILWGWDLDSLIVVDDSIKITTTMIDDCHFVHKAIIDFSHSLSEKLRKMNADHDFSSAITPRPVKIELFYSIECGFVQSKVFSYHFQTDIEKRLGFRMLAISDHHKESHYLRHLLMDATELHPEMIVSVGDVVSQAFSLDQWHSFFWQPFSADHLVQTLPMILVPGNHDANHPIAHAYSDMPHDFFDPSVKVGQLPLPKSRQRYFSQTIANSRLFFLDSNCDPIICPRQTQWLVRELSQPSSIHALFRVVFVHMPPYTEYWEDTEYDGEEFVRESWVPLFEKYNVDLVVSGHAHLYQRGKQNGVIYTIIGGGGGHLDHVRVKDWGIFEKTVIEHHFAIIQFNDCLLHWTVYNLEKEVIDSLSIASSSPQPFTCPS